MKEKIFRAGIIPYYNDNGIIKMLFMLPSDPQFGGSDFQIAKGRRDVIDITDKDTALREGNEELGLRVDNIKSITDIGNFLGRTRFFICEVFSMDNFDPPHFETKLTQWMTIQEFRKMGRVIHISVVEIAHKNICEQYVEK